MLVGHPVGATIENVAPNHTPESPRRAPVTVRPHDTGAGTANSTALAAVAVEAPGAYAPMPPVRL